MNDNSNPKLLRSKTEASEKIREQIDKGKELCKVQISSKEEYDNLRHERVNWVKYNIDLCRSLFDNSPLSKLHGYGYGVFLSNTSLAQDIEELKEEIWDAVNELEGIDQRLDLYEEITRIKKTLRYAKEGVVKSKELIKKHWVPFVLLPVMTSLIAGIILYYTGC